MLTVSFHIASIAVIIYLLISFLNTRLLPTRINKAYFVILLISLALEASDASAVVLRQVNGSNLLTATQKTMNICFCVELVLLSAMVLFYIYMSSVDKSRHTPKKHKILALAPLGVSVLVIILLPILIGGDYTHTRLSIATTASLLYLGMALFVMLQMRKDISSRMLTSFIGTVFVLVGCILWQLFTRDIFSISFGVMLCCVFLHFSLEAPMDIPRHTVKIFDRRAFISVCSTLFTNKTRFSVIRVTIDDYDLLRSSFGIAEADDCIVTIAANISKIRSSMMFITKNSEICVILKSDPEKAVENAYNISFYLSRPQLIRDMEYLLHFSVGVINCPENASTAEEIFEAIDYAFTEESHSCLESVFVLDKNLISRCRRRRDIEAILHKAVEDGGIKVFFQPIYNAKTGRIESTEALVRLTDDQTLGFISPDEFIPIAESNGLIIPLGIQIFERVCHFVAENKLYETSLSFVEINLSGVQCMQHNLSEQLNTIIHKYNIPNSFINLEITETAAMKSMQELSSNMEKMIKFGSSFSLDDFGSGYSNVQYIMSLPFSCIKLDKNMVWSYFENDNFKAKTIFETNVSMMKKLSMSVIAEGVETLEQAQKLTEIGVDYLQGFYFSRPLPEADFLEKLNQTAAEQIKEA